MEKYKEIRPGDRFTKLVVIKETISPKKWRRAWLCKCDCGNEKVAYTERLNNKETKSCGCLIKEKSSQNYKQAIKAIIKYKSKKEAGAALVMKRYKSCNDGFDLSLQEFLEITNKNCHYCGCAPYNKVETNNISSNYEIDEEAFVYSGLDRVDSSKGHTRDNIVPCCKRCNFAKNNLSVEKFEDQVRKIYHHWAKF